MRFKKSDWKWRISLPLSEIRTGKEPRRWFILTFHFMAEETIEKWFVQCHSCSGESESAASKASDIQTS